MTRRQLFGLVLAAPLAAIVPKPHVMWTDTLWGWSARNVVIRQKKVMARIRITEEVMRDLSDGPFIRARREEWARLADDIERREWQS